MKSADPTLAALIDGGDFDDFDCYTIATSSGEVLRYTVCDRDITDGTYTWSAHKVRVLDSSSRMHQSVGFNVDTWNAELAPRAEDVFTGDAYPDTIGGQPFIAACVAGALDGATLTVQRAYFPSDFDWSAGEPALCTGMLIAFSGLVGAVQPSRTTVVVPANSLAARLSKAAPRNLFQTECRFKLYRTGCGLSESDFLRAGTVAALGSTPEIIQSNVTAPPGSATYTLGQIAMTSGANAGLRRSVRTWTAGSPGTFVLLRPFPYPVQVGDGFNAIAGCNKSFAACDLFSAAAPDGIDAYHRFGGQLLIPAQEVAV